MTADTHITLSKEAKEYLDTLSPGVRSRLISRLLIAHKKCTGDSGISRIREQIENIGVEITVLKERAGEVLVQGV